MNKQIQELVAEATKLIEEQRAILNGNLTPEKATEYSARYQRLREVLERIEQTG